MIEKHQPFLCQPYGPRIPVSIEAMGWHQQSYHQPIGGSFGSRRRLGISVDFFLLTNDKKNNIHKNLYVITIFACPDFFFNFYFSVTFKKHVLSFECMVFLCVFQSFIAFPPCRSGLQSCLTDQMQSAVVKSQPSLRLVYIKILRILGLLIQNKNNKWQQRRSFFPFSRSFILVWA